MGFRPLTFLSLINPTFSGAALDEAFISNDCHENPFEHTLATYVEEDEWDNDFFIVSNWLRKCLPEDSCA